LIPGAHRYPIDAVHGGGEEPLLGERPELVEGSAAQRVLVVRNVDRDLDGARRSLEGVNFHQSISPDAVELLLGLARQRGDAATVIRQTGEQSLSRLRPQVALLTAQDAGIALGALAGFDGYEIHAVFQEHCSDEA